MSFEILVVDANEVCGDFIVQRLAAAGIAAEAVDSGANALPRLSAPALKLVIVDRLLPDLPAEHLMRTARERRAELRFVVVADALNEREYAELLNAGVSECLVRSDLGSSLVRVVETLLGRHHSGARPLDPRRQSPRFAQVLPIGVRVPTWEKFQSLYSANISRGGVFVRSADPAPIGTLVRLRFGLPDGGVLDIEGEVVHVRAGGAGKRKSSGMGIRFGTFTAEQEAMIARLVDRASSLGYEDEPIDVADLPDSDDPFADGSDAPSRRR